MIKITDKTNLLNELVSEGRVKSWNFQEINTGFCRIILENDEFSVEIKNNKFTGNLDSLGETRELSKELMLVNEIIREYLDK